MTDLMLTLRFTYDIERDARNVWESCNGDFQSPVSYLLDDRPEITIRARLWEEVAVSTIEAHSRFYQDHSALLDALLASYESYWTTERTRILELIGGIFRRDFYTALVTVYLTLSSRCPYNPNDNSFMLSIFAGPLQVLYTIAHELFHLQSWHALQVVNNGMPQSHVDEFLEIMTAVLDAEFKKFLPFHERDELNGSGLRKRAQELWTSSNDVYHVATCIREELA